MSNTPSDAELDALRQADNGALNFVTLRQFRTIARAVLAKWGAPQPVVREPLTRELVKAIMAEAGYDREAPQPRADFISGLRHGERAHCITKGGQHGAE